jgi:hypothetical protein
MPENQQYYQETKEWMSDVIQFIQVEKNRGNLSLHNIGTLISVALEKSHGSTVHPKNKLRQFQEERQQVLEHKLLFQPQRQIQKIFSMKISIK